MADIRLCYFYQIVTILFLEESIHSTVIDHILSCIYTRVYC